jgi:hypothetical protein
MLLNSPGGQILHTKKQNGLLMAHVYIIVRPTYVVNIKVAEIDVNMLDVPVIVRQGIVQ